MNVSKSVSKVSAAKGLKSLKLLAVGGIALLAAPVFADVVPQVTNSNGAHPNTGNGGVFLTVWDSTTSESIVQYLNLSLNDVLPSTITPSGGLVLDFGTVINFNSVFGNNTASNVQWHVTAFDQSGGQAGVRMATTALLPAGQSFDIDAPTVEVAANFARDFYNSLSAACPSVNSCTSASGFYGGNPNWAETLGGALGGSLPNASGALNQALQFYFAAGNDGFDAFTATIYQNASGFGQWLLGSDGHLTYSIAGAAPVPLPAGVWLLLSGLSGLGLIGRRRSGMQAGALAA